MTKLQRSLNYLASFGPIISMSALALFTFTLINRAANSPRTITLSASTTEGHNYYLDQFFTSEFGASGIVKTYVTGSSALHLDQSEQLTVKNFSFYIANQRLQIQGGANRALINDSGESMQLYEHAQVVRSTFSLPSKITTLHSNYLFVQK
jgi:LPS export ABC transporter protein LptC